MEHRNFPRNQLARDLGVRSAFGLPVLVGSRVAAVLEFFTTESVEPDESLLQVMGQIGTQIGRVVERAWTQAELQKAKDAA